MSQLPNQFSQSVIKGTVDQKGGGVSLPCMIDTTSGGGLVAGQCVKMVDSAGGVPKVVEIAADTDDVFGVIPYDIRRATLAVGDLIEILAARNGIIYMEASAAIARDAKVMAVVSGSKVATATTGKTIIGRALDKAANAGDLIRVILDLPGSAA